MKSLHTAFSFAPPSILSLTIYFSPLSYHKQSRFPIFSSCLRITDNRNGGGSRLIYIEYIWSRAKRKDKSDICKKFLFSTFYTFWVKKHVFSTSYTFWVKLTTFYTFRIKPITSYRLEAKKMKCKKKGKKKQPRARPLKIWFFQFSRYYSFWVNWQYFS